MKTLFKYSILLSLHYYDIIYHNTPNDFEKDNPIFYWEYMMKIMK